MANFRSFNDLVLSYLEFYRNAQPNLTVNPGSVARDLFIDGQAAQVSRLYEELNRISNLQSQRLAIGSDLDKLVANYGATRKKGSKATGPALLTFDSLDTDISLNKGDLITAKNGSTFIVNNSLLISSVLASNYQAIAARFRADLDFLGNTDRYAVQVLVTASASGNQGNISKYGLVSTNISGINHVTNTSPFGGGQPAENDNGLRSRVLGIFSGANTGTALGYENAAKGDPSVKDAVVIEPGDPLMTRDGTQVSIASDGTRTIISEGTGGKVDVLVFGSRLQESSDSFVYRDKSNTDDPRHSLNDFSLGQILGDEDKTITKKRIDNLKTSILPSQPINNLVSISGSGSGPNFIEKQVDSLGRVTGNYALLQDTGAFAGSPWGQDKLHWISDRISDYPEDKTKNSFNSQDSLAFPGLLEIKKVQQNIIITNENSRVKVSDRSSIQLGHAPISSVTRVFNLTTGERYVVVNQNPDGTGSLNLTGRIVVSGRTLPTVSDLLQVDYTWVYSFDPYFDFDNRINNNNIRLVEDSLDWGLSNAVRRERVVVSTSGSYLTAVVTHPISSVVSVNTFIDESGLITLSGGRLALTVVNEVSNVVSIIRTSDSAELWKTVAEDGSFNNLVVYLPTDTVGGLNESVTITYNAEDVFNTEPAGSFNSNTISMISGGSLTAGTIVECNYLSDISVMLPATSLSNLPAIRSGNFFNLNSSSNVGCQPATHVFSGSEILQNLRQGPSPLALNISGNISSGILTIGGTTISLVSDLVFTATSDGLKQDLAVAVKSFLGLNSKTSIPTTVKICRLDKFEKVRTTSSLDVLEVLQTYDLRGYHLLDNSLVKSESISDSTLKSTEAELPNTIDNVDGAPEVGDRLRARFHLSISNDSENIYFTKAGTQYTNKKFIFIDTIAISSGFTSTQSSSALLTVNNFNQPNSKTRYKAFYDYLAPQTNERITVTYNYDRIITDTTLTIESTRPITADVLVKAADALLVDVTMNIVVTPEFVNSSTIVKQNVQDALSSALEAQALGTTIDASDLIQVAYTVTGVDRARILFFNKSDVGGSVLSITAQNNEYIFPNDVIVELESR